jgi:hypothetical protein
MFQFNESFVGGFFGFYRTYGAVVRFECASVAELEADWPKALREVADWRSHRGERATVLHLYPQVQPDQVWSVVGFLTRQLLVPPATRSPELQHLRLEVAVFGVPAMEQHLDLVIYPEPTGEDPKKSGHDVKGERV